MLKQIEALLIKRPVILQLLRFVAIGVLNYTIDAIVFNFVSKYFGITEGSKLGLANIPGFIIAVLQSYLWNRYWAFGADMVTVLRNFVRLVLVGVLGVIGFVLVLAGAQNGFPAMYYLLIFALFFTFESILWLAFDLAHQMKGQVIETHFVSFFVVSIIGLLINIFIVSVASTYLNDHQGTLTNPDLIKNAAKIIATAVSLVWNFLGYKLLVFKK